MKKFDYSKHHYIIYRLREVHQYDYYYTGCINKTFPLRVKSFTSYLDFMRMKTPQSDDNVQSQTMIHLHPFPGFDLSWFLLFPFYFYLTTISNERLNVCMQLLKPKWVGK